METVIALGLLAVLLVGMSGLFLRLLAGSEKGNDTTAGTMLAEQLLQQQAAGGIFENNSGISRLYTHDGSAAVEYVYQITCAPMTVSPSGSNVYYVDVQVTWMGASRHTQGQLRARAGRLVTP